MLMIHLRILADFVLLDLVWTIPVRAAVHRPRLPVAYVPAVSIHPMSLLYNVLGPRVQVQAHQMYDLISALNHIMDEGRLTLGS